MKTGRKQTVLLIKTGDMETAAPCSGQRLTADALIKPQPCEDRRPLCLENSKVPCTPTLAGPPETRAAWPLAFPFVLEGAPQVHPLPTPLPLCPSHFRAWRFWAKQGSRAIPTMSFSYCCPCFTVPSHGRLHAAGQTIAQAARSSQGKRAGLGPWHGTVFGWGKEEACAQQVVMMTTPACGGS